jgi:hypothetical protein
MLQRYSTVPLPLMLSRQACASPKFLNPSSAALPVTIYFHHPQYTTYCTEWRLYRTVLYPVSKVHSCSVSTNAVLVVLQVALLRPGFVVESQLDTVFALLYSALLCSFASIALSRRSADTSWTAPIRHLTSGCQVTTTWRLVVVCVGHSKNLAAASKTLYVQ